MWGIINTFNHLFKTEGGLLHIKTDGTIILGKRTMDYSVLFYSWINSEEYKIRDSKKTIQKQIDYGFDGDIRSSVVEKYDEQVGGEQDLVLTTLSVPTFPTWVGWMLINQQQLKRYCWFYQWRRVFSNSWQSLSSVWWFSNSGWIILIRRLNINKLCPRNDRKGKLTVWVVKTRLFVRAESTNYLRAVRLIISFQ